MHPSSIGLLTLAAIATSTLAETPSAPENEPRMEEVVVQGLRQRLHAAGTLADVIQKTEVVDEQSMLARNALNLSQAIEQSPGVRVSNECSMCGVKRIMLNGMRGEHTTILTDGIPLHTMLAGYYAVDAIATTGVSRIEVARGAGASLISPEAIGGTINVISRMPDVSGVELNMQSDDDDGWVVGAFGGLASDDGRTKASLVVQMDEHGEIDADNNRVSESPSQDNDNYIARLSHDLTDRDNLTVRVGYTESEIFGGPTFVGGIDSVRRNFDGVESEQLFQGDDVRNRFTGKAWETTEWIDTERVEAYATWLHEFSADYNAALTVAYSDHDQDSFYEGFDYHADDELYYFDLRNNYAWGDDHLVTFGVDWRSEEMRSDSEAGAASENYIEDSFDYDVIGLYVQDTWTINDQLEVALALRVDQAEADFVAPEKPGTEIDETVFAPRMDLRYMHSDQWTSRISAGRGYRAPLSFFESDHGILDAGDGFAIDIDELEESVSLGYALSFEGEQLSSTLSLAHTNVDNLASIDETDEGVPLLTQLDDDASVTAADIVVGYRPTDWLELSATLEHYDYDSNFQDSFAIAPVEERAILTAEVNYQRWQVFTSLTWIGERDLADYGYEGFNILGDESSLKDSDADAYATVDMRIAYSLTDSVDLYVGAINLFDYTQVEEDETPLFWDADGGYDVAYIYGPLRSREFYAGVNISL